MRPFLNSIRAGALSDAPALDIPSWRDIDVGQVYATPLSRQEKEIVLVGKAVFVSNVILCKWAIPGNIEVSFSR